uniref:Uncharacterized protein n=1 Tax=Tetradesmus obliquus TaxID=3088 RepID=A0A383V8W7_TETOB|eukprot:jgi/Sobl393_1/12099/SZX61034.1
MRCSAGQVRVAAAAQQQQEEQLVLGRSGDGVQQQQQQQQQQQEVLSRLCEGVAVLQLQLEGLQLQHQCQTSHFGNAGLDKDEVEDLQEALLRYAAQIEKAELEFGDKEELESKLEELLAAAPEPADSDEEDSEESD